MAHKKNNKPKLKIKEGNMHLQIFKNKGAHGTYAVIKITSYRFPFGKYNQSVSLMPIEIERLMKVFARMPKIEFKQKQPKINKPFVDKEE